ncbi:MULTISPECIES: DUF2141 domain-containing protein [unclassified Duganella]|uniref:DUF2141 domain-containing protein n=1 Tax=unclassified Duganella TaxID=2636909 RepID=UPI000884346F|nr:MULTISPECIES: DUF2141 domain-containing protein [unclassified Duganella]SDF78219.1 Uncharacterized conserved protein, DUF2141 family [Duganella sp. OV458]SDI50854.1 Uncharacterized conserved protein, DUF2141 family [Duganella sp. OV510]
MSRLIFALLFSAALPSHAADLAIRIDGVASAEGEIKIALYNSADTFLGKPLRGVAAPARQGTVDVVIADLPAGDYAFAVYHDTNNNGKMDRNAMGMPTEDYAFSNNAMGKRSAPRYEDARVALPEGGATVTVNLR